MPTMPCPLKDRNQEILLDYVSRRLQPAEAAAVESHAAECVPCRQFIAEQAAIWAVLDDYAATPVAADFDERLYARIAAQDEQPWWRRAWRRVFESGEPGSWRPAVGLSAMCAVVLAGILIQLPRQQPSVSAPTTTKIESVKTASADMPDVESVERVLEDVEMLKLVSSGSSL